MASFTFVLGDGCTIPGIGLGTFQIAAADAEAAGVRASHISEKKQSLKIISRHVQTF